MMVDNLDDQDIEPLVERYMALTSHNFSEHMLSAGTNPLIHNDLSEDYYFEDEYPK